MHKKGYSFAIIFILLILSNISFSQESVFTMELPFPLNFGINKGFGENSKIWSSGISLGFNPFIKVYKNFYFGMRVSYDQWVPNKEEIYKNEVPKYVADGSLFLRDTPPSSFVCKGSYEIIGIEQVTRIFLPKIFQTEINTFIQLGVGRYEYESNYSIKLIDSEPS